MPPLPLSPFRRAAAELVGSSLGLDPSLFAVTTPPDASLGDYAVGCFPGAKSLRAAPAALAQQVVSAFQPTELLASAQALGPYVNVRVQRAALFAHLAHTALAQPPQAIPPIGAGQTVCVDFSSPNIAKHLSYHHIRSTVIGQALCHIHRALGYHTVGINHLGDWGTTFGMLLAAYHRWGAPEPLTISTLNDLYVRFRQAMKEEPALEDEGRAWFKRLEDGDSGARALWQRFRDISLAEFQEVYDLLGIHFDAVKGESEYEAAMPAVIERLTQQGLTSISQGALVVELQDEKLPPCLLRKDDGATLYATRDLAAAQFRWDTYHFERCLYVVDKGQALHFQQLKAVLTKAGAAWADNLVHVAFGLVRIGGRKSGTRSGNVVLLKDVLDEAQERIAALIRDKNPDLVGEAAQKVAREVGIGAIVFANLASQREKDIDFEWESVLSTEGDAGPYVQYSHARAASILRKGGSPDRESLRSADHARLVRDEEWALARLLCDLGGETARAADSDEPHIIARYLLEVCGAFSRWYTLGNQDPSLKVITADEATTRARLALCAATRETLRMGLGLLGMSAPDEM
jgi:arginyl-tRNA synthetase